MNRRELFGLLPGLGLSGLITKNQSTEPFGGITKYRGFVRFFTGWKSSYDSMVEVAQYFGVGHPSGLVPFVVSTGTWGFTRKGYAIPMQYLYPHFYLISSDSVRIHDFAQEQMHDALCRLIDHFHTIDWGNLANSYGFPPPPLVHPEFPDYFGWRDLRKAGIYEAWKREVDRG